jgi:hypothetical protein
MEVEKAYLRYAKAATTLNIAGFISPKCEERRF